MRKLFALEDFIVAFASSVAYGAGFLIPNFYGVSAWICGLISIVIGGIVFGAVEKLAANKYFQVKPVRKKIFFVFVILMFLLADAVCFKIWNKRLYMDLASCVGWAAGFPVAVLFASSAVRWYKVKKMREQYGDGAEGCRFDENDIAQLCEFDGVNGKITGEYDEKLAVKTKNGTFVGKERKKVRAFLGIPYAAAERWKAPVPPENSDEVYEACNFGPSALQTADKRNFAGYLRQSEQCLTLNIWTADEDDGKKRPVLVYIHGGDFSYGSATVPLYHGEEFVRRHRDTVFVSFNYRLGIFGFANFSGLPGAEEYPDTQNLGLLDQIAALKWVKENIAAFGGDPENVTIAGEHAGAVSALLLSVVKQAAGLFGKAVVLTGNQEFLYPAEQQHESSMMFAKAAGAANMQQLLELAPEKLLSAQAALGSYITMPVCAGIVPNNIYRAFAEGAAKDINILAGLPKDEFGSWVTFMGEADSFEFISSTLKEEMKSDSERGRLLKKLYDEQISFGVSEKAAVEMLFSRFVCEAGLLLACRMQSAAGGIARCFRWSAESPVEKFGASSYSCLFYLLGNRSYAEKCGYLCNAALEDTVQTCLVNFMKNGDPSLYLHEVKNIDEIDWKPFAKKEAIMEFKEDSAVHGAEDILEYCRKFDELLLNS